MSYLQRQFSASLLLGSSTSAAARPVSERVMDISDTYPGNILIIDDGATELGGYPVAASGSQVLALPEGYTSASRLGVMICGTQSFKVVIVSPDNTTSTTLVKAGTTADELAFISWVGTVTSITVTNLSSTTAAVITAGLFSYPADIAAAAAWRSGFQTVGI